MYCHVARFPAKPAGKKPSRGTCSAPPTTCTACMPPGNRRGSYAAAAAAAAAASAVLTQRRGHTQTFSSPAGCLHGAERSLTWWSSLVVCPLSPVALPALRSVSPKSHRDFVAGKPHGGAALGPLPPPRPGLHGGPPGGGSGRGRRRPGRGGRRVEGDGGLGDVQRLPAPSRPSFAGERSIGRPTTRGACLCGGGRGGLCIFVLSGVATTGSGWGGDRGGRAVARYRRPDVPVGFSRVGFCPG